MRWGLLAIVLMVVGCQRVPETHVWTFDTLQPHALSSGSDASLRGLCAVSDRVAWASGSGGTVLRTTDGGATWERLVVEGADEMDFRDVHAFDDRSAVLMVAGDPPRFYRTEDGGETWTIVYEHDTPGAFFDAMDFRDRRHGLAFSDPVGDTLLVITTSDGGRSWSPVRRDRLPRALGGEAGFAASGSCLVIHGDDVWIGLGGETGATGARVYHSGDLGASWGVVTTPMASAAAAGVFSLDFADGKRGIAVGGIYSEPDVTDRHIMRTADGGRTWWLVTGAATRAYRSAVRYAPNTDGMIVIATGPSGTDLSMDGGRSWRALSDEGWHAIEFTPGGRTAWFSGSGGRIARIGPIER